MRYENVGIMSLVSFKMHSKSVRFDLLLSTVSDVNRIDSLSVVQAVVKRDGKIFGEFHNSVHFGPPHSYFHSNRSRK